MGTVRRSASVLLARSWSSSEVYLVLRGLEQRAFPGTYVFPGGKIDPEDRQVAVRARDPQVEPEAYVAAARELLEEVGVLPAARRGGGPLPAEGLARARVALLEGERPFRELLRDLDAEIDGEMLVPLGEKTTPPFHPQRFRNRFFMAVLPEGQRPEVHPGELDSGGWFEVEAAVAAFGRGEMLLSPPILLLCEAWGGLPARQALPSLRGFSDQALAHRPLRIRFSPEVILFPGKTPTLPPATHTNTYLVGAERLLVVDPATDDPEDQAKLHMLLDELATEGKRIEAIVLTHHHVDHVGAVEAVRTWTGAPVWGHALTAERMPGTRFDRLLEDGETVNLGGGGDVTFVHTPGHAAGHLCLFQEKFQSLIAGDMVSTASTILIDPRDEGDMAQYLASLEKLLALGARVLHPAHGDSYPRADRLLQRFLDHRRMRADRALAALAEPRTMDQLVPVVYDDTPPETWPLAAISLEATLIQLEREGRVRRTPGPGWAAT